MLREFLSDQQEAWPLQSSACSLPSDRHQHIGTGAVLDLQRQQASNQADLDILCSSKRHRWDEHQDHVGMYMDGEAGITIDHLSDIDGTLQSAGHERLISQGQFDNMQPLTIGDVLL